jgi:hypothetical protein
MEEAADGAAKLKKLPLPQSNKNRKGGWFLVL